MATSNSLTTYLHSLIVPFVNGGIRNRDIRASWGFFDDSATTANKRWVYWRTGNAFSRRLGQQHNE